MRQDFNFRRCTIAASILGVVAIAFLLFYVNVYEGAKIASLFRFWLIPRIWVAAILAAIGLVLLVKTFVTRRLRFLFLCGIFFVFALFPILPLGTLTAGMAMHPSPMCIITKPFLFIAVGRLIPIGFLSFILALIILTVAGNKLFCGWACPVGALQELFHRIPFPKRIRFRLAFWITNTIRVLLFVLFVPVFYFLGVIIYDYINPFEFLHWRFELWGSILVSVILIASLFIFRPFCYAACPLGLITWLFEQLSLVRVNVDRDKCTMCNICIKESPCPTVPAILKGKVIRPDCHPCGRCIELCPEDALRFN